MRKRGSRLFKRRRGNRTRRGERPEYRTHPPRLAAFGTFLTLSAQRTGATMADACSVEHAEGAVVLRPALLWIERMISGTAQRSVRLRSKSGPWKATRERGTCEFRRTILNRRGLFLS